MQRPSVNEVLLEAINRCGTWLEAKELARLTGISIAKCKIALPQLVEANQIGVKYQATLRSGDEVPFYAKSSLAKQEALTRNNSQDIRFAKSRFEGGKHKAREYQPMKNFHELTKLAMLYRQR